MEMHRPLHSRREVLRTLGITAAAGLLVSCGGDDDDDAADDDGGGGGGGVGGNFPDTPEWNFVFINHVTTNPFFVPTQYGIEDASALLGTKFQWTGSERADNAEMVNAFEAAIAANADGIAVAIVDLEAFNDPIERALAAGIPVVSYNADAANARLAYIGQDLYGSGFEMGKRIVELVGEGDVALFIATPGQLNIQPRIDGAIAAIEESGAAINVADIATGATLEEELSAIEAYYLGNTGVAGMFAVDAGSTQGVGQVVQTHDARGGGPQGLRRLRPVADHGRVGVRRRARLHHRPAAIPSGIPPGAVPVPVEAVGRRRPPARDQHRVGVPRFDIGEAVPRHVEPLRGRRRGAEDRRASGLSGPPHDDGDHRARRPQRVHGRAASGIGQVVRLPASDLIARRREASIAFVAVVLFVYFAASTPAFMGVDNIA